MSTEHSLWEAKWKPGVRYFYASKSMLTMHLLVGDMALCGGRYLPLYTKKPPGMDCHRIEISVIRTKKEAAAMKIKWTKKRRAIKRASELLRITPGASPRMTAAAERREDGA